MNKQFQELNTKPLEELRKIEVDFREKLWKLTEDLKRGKVKNILEVHELKKNVARVLTAINAKMKLDKTVK